jgi:hypothetical protein
MRCRYLALTWAAQFFEPAPVAPGMHTVGLQAQDLYARFCSYVRGTSPVILPMACNQDGHQAAGTSALVPGQGASAADSGAGTRAPPNNNRGWFRLRRGPRRSPSMNTAGGPQRKTQVVGDFIQDKQWGGQPSQQAKFGGKSQEGGGRGAKVVLTAARSPSSCNLAQLATMPPLQEVNSAGHMGKHRPFSLVAVLLSQCSC